jgi:16S rRNA (guanine(527)-N(7))-methyltransferase RsmG
VFRELLREELRGLIELTTEQSSALEAHYELLVRWNRILNLTSIESAQQVVERHYCESLFLAAHLPPGPLQIADIGSGAGFPGFPVAVVRPDCVVTLIEGHRRKAVFLREASRDRSNIRVLAVRAEEVGERFDRAAGRAVSYRDLKPFLKNLAPAADLLIGEERPPEELGFCWGEPIRLPWGKNRFLISGVSREIPHIEFHVKH